MDPRPLKLPAVLVLHHVQQERQHLVEQIVETPNTPDGNEGQALGTDIQFA